MEELVSLLIPALSILALAALGIVLVRLLARQVRRAVRSARHIPGERQQQLLTLIQILRWGADLLIVGVAALMLLSRFGVDVTPVLASAGVVGLAVGFGAQTLVKDLIGGLLVLIENQYAVGDAIQVGDLSGSVERFTLRATYLRDVHGRLHIIPNGEIRIVSNMTKDWSRAVVEVGVAYEEDLDRVLAVLGRVAEAFAKDPVFGPKLLEPPQVVGPISLGDWAVTVRVMAKTLPGEQWGVTRELQKRVLAACDEADITLPYPRQEVWVRGQEDAGAQ